MNINPLQSQCTLFRQRIGAIESWMWPSVDIETFRIIFADWIKYYDPFLRKEFASKNGTVIQAGGNCGMYPLLYTAFFNRVYTFEPDPLSFFCLAHNCQYGNIYKFNCALGHRPGYVDIIQSPQADNRGMNRVKEVITPSIPSITLDSFWLDDVKLIQLDLEGFEQWALEGAVETIKRNKPVIIVECSLLNVEQVEKILHSLDYRKCEQLTPSDRIYRHKK